MKMLIMIAGVAGTGKTTLAKKFLDSNLNAVHFEADQFFLDENGNYHFNGELLPKAHRLCLINTENAMLSNCSLVIVSNTFTRQWERKPYLILAKKYGYIVNFIHLTKIYGNIHEVPEEIVKKQGERFEPFVNEI